PGDPQPARAWLAPHHARRDRARSEGLPGVLAACAAHPRSTARAPHARGSEAPRAGARQTSRGRGGLMGSFRWRLWRFGWPWPRTTPRAPWTRIAWRRWWLRRIRVIGKRAVVEPQREEA